MNCVHLHHCCSFHTHTHTSLMVNNKTGKKNRVFLFFPSNSCLISLWNIWFVLYLQSSNNHTNKSIWENRVSYCCILFFFLVWSFTFLWWIMSKAGFFNSWFLTAILSEPFNYANFTPCFEKHSSVMLEINNVELQVKACNVCSDNMLKKLILSVQIWALCPCFCPVLAQMSRWDEMRRGWTGSIVCSGSDLTDTARLCVCVRTKEGNSMTLLKRPRMHCQPLLKDG